MLIFLVFCVTIEIVHSDDSFRIGISKLNSTTESSLWTLFLLFQLHFTMRLYVKADQKRYFFLKFPIDVNYRKKPCRYIELPLNFYPQLNIKQIELVLFARPHNAFFNNIFCANFTKNKRRHWIMH